MIHMENIVKAYALGGETIYALDHVSLDVAEGEYVAITGPSGSGKSTLMNIIGCLDVADSGVYILNDKKIEKYSSRQLAHLRNTHIGFIFQGFNLLQKLSALENVELPLIYQKISPVKRKARALSSLEAVGLKERAGHKPSELSGGQQQRCAIARALVTDPKLILADEPTGNLDSKTGLEILNLFDHLHQAGNTIVLITHDAGVAARAQRVIHIVDGKIWEGAPVTDTVDHVDHIMTPGAVTEQIKDRAVQPPVITDNPSKPNDDAAAQQDEPLKKCVPFAGKNADVKPAVRKRGAGSATGCESEKMTGAQAAQEEEWDGTDISIDETIAKRYTIHDSGKEESASYGINDDGAQSDQK